MVTGRRARGIRIGGIRLTASLVVAVLAAALLAAGCGSDSSSDPSADANAAYASGVCTAIGTWKQQVTSIVTGLTGRISKASLQTAVTQIEAATTTLTTEVAAVPPPDTEEGQAAKQQVDQLASSLTTTVDSATSTISQLPPDASGGAVAVALSGLAPQVQSLATTATTTLASLKDAGGSLATAFKETDSCTSLRG